MNRSKGLSMLKFVDNYTVIDIETTGCSLFYDEIIEISAAKYRNNELTHKYSTLIKCDREINPFIMELTGISNEMVANAPKLTDVLAEFIKFLSDDILIGHNINFDINFLYDAMFKHNNYNLSNNYIDTLRLSRRILRDLDNHKLTTIAGYFGIERNIHRGFEDCEVTNTVYQKIRQMIEFDELDAEGNIIAVSKPKNSNKNLSSIKPTVSNEELFSHIDDFFFEKNTVITGKLTYYTKFELGQIIVNKGGYFSDNVTSETDILILGNTDYQESLYNSKSGKHKKAEKMIHDGHDIKIIDEFTAYSLLNLSF